MCVTVGAGDLYIMKTRRVARKYTIALRDRDYDIPQKEGFDVEVRDAEDPVEFVYGLVATLQKTIERLLSKKKYSDKLRAGADILAIARELIKLEKVSIEDTKRLRVKLAEDEDVGEYDAQRVAVYTPIE